MKSGKGHLEEEEEEDDEFGVRKDTTPSANSTKDGKNNDKASAMRSKHSVTEQRRRSKINERFQKLRELIPHSDQKRDTASFLFEVIQYVQLLQEKVQKYEGSYQPWGSEPMKLMPWRNSQWRVQSFVGQPQTMKNGSGPGASSPGRFDDRIAVATTMPHGVPMPLQTTMAVPIANNDAFSLTLHGQPSDPQSTNCPSAADNLNHQDELTIEGGTISISSVYSEELLNSLAQALESTGVDLSQARISVQINLGKRANQGSPTGISVPKEHAIPMPAGNEPVGNFHAANNSADLDRAQKRQKI
ncbi:transcription factor BIM2 isoform X2 [Andrographis paniculata]|uniref:transcription factor BIM2 isoform X2 n=1 Tax=Andrographis paniculata TaxID=175694 RepID=UPI0021E832A9|nr:transcription factor BIM2 isoform X2 [Andrographis paniculata]